MVNSLKSKRIKFPTGKQRLFIEKCRSKLGYTLNELAKYLNVNIRTLTDWKREKFLMPLSAVQKLSRKAEISIPRGGELRDKFWYTLKGARRGGISTYKKYGMVGGDPIRRKKRWREWWEKIGKYENRSIFRPLPFNKPKQSSALAEFIGIMMGDGGISQRQITITLHHKDDLAYSKFVIKLINKLFGVSPKVYHSPRYSINDIVVSRVSLVRYLHDIGLPIGNKVKQKFDIPEWIKRKKSFQIACVRGLVDTDGSVFTHTYAVNGKQYSYKRIAFTSMSQPLTKSVHGILQNVGLNPRLSQNKDVRIDSIENVRRYFDVIGSHNPKHLKRYFG